MQLNVLTMREWSVRVHGVQEAPTVATTIALLGNLGVIQDVADPTEILAHV